MALSGTRIYQSRVCADNEYHTCGLSLASAARSHLKNCYMRTMKCRTQRGYCFCGAAGEILPCVWELKYIVSTLTSLLKYFVWVFLTFQAPNRCKIPVLWKINLIVITISWLGILYSFSTVVAVFFLKEKLSACNFQVLARQFTRNPRSFLLPWKRYISSNKRLKYIFEQRSGWLWQQYYLSI